MKRIITAFLFFFISGSMLTAQQLPFRTYSIESGLSESVVYDIVQDQMGFVWAATGYGLNRFDGQNFHIFYQENGLKANKVFTLLEGHDGRIWIGTESGVNFFKDDSVQTTTALAPLDHHQVISFFEDSNQELWIGTDGAGVWHYDKAGNLHQYTTVHGLVNNKVRAIAEDENNALWFATRGGLTVLENGSFRSFTTKDGLPVNLLRDLYIDRSQTLWIATRRGLTKYENNQFITYTKKDEGIVNDRIRSLTPEGRNTLWLGTEEGVSHVSIEGGVPIEIKNYNVQNGLSNNIVYASMLDREGNMWFGTFGGGLNIFLGDYFENYTADQGLSNEVVTDIREDSNGDIWISTYGGGIMRFNNGDFEWFNVNDGLTDEKLYSLSLDERGTLWIGTRWGLNYFDEGENTFKSIPDEIFPYRKIRDILELGNGKRWFATYDEGVIFFDGETYRQYTEEDGLPSNTILDAEKAGDGSVWFATYGGVSNFRDGIFTNYSIQDGLINNSVLDATISDDGALWFSTFGGVSRFKNGRFESLTVDEGLPDPVCYFVHQSKDGFIWIGTGEGVVRIDYSNPDNQNKPLEELALRIISDEEGLVANETNSSAIFEDSEGNLWIGTVGGVSKFYPKRFVKKTETSIPNVHIFGISSSGKNYELSDDLYFSNTENFIQISYAALSFTAPGQVTYRYSIKGIDPEWQITSERIARYPSLPSGDYTFEVMASNENGIWSEEKAAVHFSITPPFWLQWWFLLFVLILITGAVFFFYNFYRVKKMVEIERLRVRIASDLHDDVGASLTEIALQSDFLQATDVSEEVKKPLRQIGKQSRRIVNSLDDIVWSIDARNDTLGDFTDRMQDYVNNLFSHKNMDINYNFDDLNMDKKLPVTLKENLYLIFKEAVNNIAKYSNGDRVNISMLNQNGTYEFIIHDNGNAGEGNKKTGHGLRNMEMRAHRIGADIDIDNHNGFTVKVAGKLNVN